MLNVKFIENVLNQKVIGSNEKNVNFLNIDSRNIKPGDCFIAIKGKNHDPNNYIIEAINSGAEGFIINETHLNLFLENKKENNWCFSVKDTYEALYKIAYEWRRNLNIPFIAITGSYGKTTTKDIISSCLEKINKNIYFTKKSENGLIGLPRTILGITNNNELAICEVGISEIGEMDKLSNLVKPKIAIITNLGFSHIEKFKNCFETLKNEKFKIAKDLTENDFLIINSDTVNELDLKDKTKGKIIKFGFNNNNDINIKILNDSNDKYEIEYSFDNKKFILNFPFKNKGIITCIGGAFALFKILNIDINKEILNNLENFMPQFGRYSIHKIQNFNSIIINDCYNANPMSMENSIKSFSSINKDLEKILILGDMFELGEKSNELHESVLNEANKYNFKEIILVGNNMKIASNKFNFNYKYFENSIDAKKYFENILNDKKIFLFKGSRGMKLEEIFSNLKLEQINKI